MTKSVVGKLLVCVLIIALQSVYFPVSAEKEDATLTGTVILANEKTPLVGVTVYVGDPKTGEVYRSTATLEDGGFSIDNLPAATYEVAVEAEEGLYLIKTPISFDPGQNRALSIAVNRNSGSPAEVQKIVAERNSLFDNALTAAGAVVGIAFAIGWLLEESTDDEPPPDQQPPMTSPAMPG